MKEGKEYSLRVFCFLEGRQSFITMVTVTPGLTVFLQLVGQGVNSSLGREQFLCEVSKVLFAFFQLGVQVLVGFQDAHFCPQTRESGVRYGHAEA